MRTLRNAPVQTEVQEVQSSRAFCAKGLVTKKKKKKNPTSWKSTSQPGPTSCTGVEKGSEFGAFVMPLSRETWFSRRVKLRLGN